jgi:hypothetical protein
LLIDFDLWRHIRADQVLRTGRSTRIATARNERSQRANRMFTVQSWATSCSSRKRVWFSIAWMFAGPVSK